VSLEPEALFTISLAQQNGHDMAINPGEPQTHIASTQRDDPALGSAELIAEYEAGPDLLRATVAGMTAEEMRLRAVAGKWSSLEVVCHVSDCEQFFADRMKRTLAMNRPLLVGADGWLYPEAVRYHDRDPEEELALVALTRRQMARILKLVPEEAWQRQAVHTETGLVTLRELLLHASRHLKHHVAFIEEKQQALAGAASTGSQQPRLTAAASDPHEVARQGDFLISTDPGLLDLPSIHDFLTNRSYWAKGRPLEVFRRSLANSLCFGLYEQRRQVGFARVVTDRATFAWLCDVFVLENYRGRGLAKWLIECVLGHPALQGLRRVLLGTRDAHGLYQRYGFAPLADPTRFMEIFRPRPS
jgi:GNAT superfamily N-acetyltransferase